MTQNQVGTTRTEFRVSRPRRVELSFASAYGAPCCLDGIVDPSGYLSPLYARNMIFMALSEAGLPSRKYTTERGSIGLYIDSTEPTSQQRTIILDHLSGPLAYLRPVLERVGILS